MIAEFSIENFFSIKSVQKISFEPSADTYMSDEYSYEVKDGKRMWIMQPKKLIVLCHLRHPLILFTMAK